MMRTSSPRPMVRTAGPKPMVRKEGPKPTVRTGGSTDIARTSNLKLIAIGQETLNPFEALSPLVRTGDRRLIGEDRRH
jgi:hypothetical protein